MVAMTHRCCSSSGQSPRRNGVQFDTGVSLSATASFCPARVPAAHTQLRKLQNLQIKVVLSSGTLCKSHIARGLNVAACRLPFVCDLNRKLCRQQAQIAQNKGNQTLVCTGEGDGEQQAVSYASMWRSSAGDRPVSQLSCPCNKS